MCRAERAEEGRVLELTFCPVELGECMLTDVTVPEEHAELTSAQMSPYILGVDYQHISEE